MAETVRAALASATRALETVSPSARLDAELLMAHALGTEREKLLLSLQNSDAPASFPVLLARRLKYEPVAYITETRDFWTLTLWTPRGVLIPRPDSETLIEAAMTHFGERAPMRVLDLGTGSGALLLTALSHWPGANGLGIDASDYAIDVATINADKANLASRASFRLGNWATGLDGQFDLILCNPPYVETTVELAREVRDFEPDAALFAGVDGLDAYRLIAPQLPALLAPSGCACIEIGSEQAASVSALFVVQSFEVALRRDLAGRDRCLVLTHKS